MLEANVILFCKKYTTVLKATKYHFNNTQDRTLNYFLTITERSKILKANLS